MFIPYIPKSKLVLYLKESYSFAAVVMVMMLNKAIGIDSTVTIKMLDGIIRTLI